MRVLTSLPQQDLLRVPDVTWAHQFNLVPKLHDLPRPIVCAPTRLHSHQTRLKCARNSNTCRRRS